MDHDKCNGCGECLEGCYVSAISLKEGKACIDQDMCKGCARCAHICPERAITLHLEDMDFLERTVEMLDPLVDVTKA